MVTLMKKSQKEFIQSIRHFGRVSKLILQHGYNANNLSNNNFCILPYCRNTVQAKIETPGTFTLFDLKNIVDDGEITVDELIAALREDFT